MTEIQRLAKIMVLKDMRKEYELRAKYNGGVDYDCYRALDMAIEELEQEPCTDAISRQAVLEVIEKCHCEEWVKADIGAPIEALQPVNPTEKVGQWIPVSERYPEDGQRVLVDYCDEDAGIMLIRFNVNGYHGFKAWMPLPLPYKQEVEE